MAEWVLPYMKAMSLDNGYRFFAPDPGPSHLIRYEVWRGSKELAAGQFPDRQRHRPRLLYHRYFMISEMTAARMIPPLSPAEQSNLTPTEREQYEADRRSAMMLPRDIARRLLWLHPDAERVRLFLRRHRIPTPDEVRRGLTLTDPSTYEELPLGEFTRESS